MARLKMAKKKKPGYAKKPSSDFHLGFVAHCNAEDVFAPRPKCNVDSEKEFDPRKYPVNDSLKTKKR